MLWYRGVPHHSLAPLWDERELTLMILTTRICIALPMRNLAAPVAFVRVTKRLTVWICWNTYHDAIVGLQPAISIEMHLYEVRISTRRYSHLHVGCHWRSFCRASVWSTLLVRCHCAFDYTSIPFQSSGGSACPLVSHIHNRSQCIEVLSTSMLLRV